MSEIQNFTIVGFVKPSRRIETSTNVLSMEDLRLKFFPFYVSQHQVSQLSGERVSSVVCWVFSFRWSSLVPRYFSAKRQNLDDS